MDEYNVIVSQKAMNQMVHHAAFLSKFRQNYPTSTGWE